MENPYHPPPQPTKQAEPKSHGLGRLPMVGAAIGMFAGIAVAANKGLYPGRLEPLLSHIGTGGMSGWFFGACVKLCFVAIKRLWFWK